MLKLTQGKQGPSPAVINWYDHSPVLSNAHCHIANRTEPTYPCFYITKLKAHSLLAQAERQGNRIWFQAKNSRVEYDHFSYSCAGYHRKDAAEDRHRRPDWRRKFCILVCALRIPFPQNKHALKSCEGSIGAFVTANTHDSEPPEVRSSCSIGTARTTRESTHLTVNTGYCLWTSPKWFRPERA
jgi:hypothetical protein